MIEPRIGSVCSGTGALDMAVMEVFGGSMAWHCQYEPPDKKGREDKHQYAARILAHHWPAAPNHGDLTAVDWNRVEPVDIFTAGFPCTDLSYAGRGEGIKEGTRSGLWLTIARAIGALRPRLVVLENVRAIVNRRPGLDIVLADLANLGLDAEWVCVRASDDGAPHPRDRWFLLAWPAADAANLGHEWGRPAWQGWDGSADSNLAASDASGGGRLAWADTQRWEAFGRDAADGGGALGVDWGIYGPAIRRWERILGRPAPRPTQPGGTGGEQLSPWFVEWMMGLPAGHVTDVPAPPGMKPAGLRRARIKALGNGVVRQQAVHALHLLAVRAFSEAAA